VVRRDPSAVNDEIIVAGPQPVVARLLERKDGAGSRPPRKQPLIGLEACSRRFGHAEPGIIEKGNAPIRMCEICYDRRHLREHCAKSATERIMPERIIDFEQICEDLAMI